jgi:WD40 repeat protein
MPVLIGTLVLLLFSHVGLPSGRPQAVRQPYDLIVPGNFIMAISPDGRLIAYVAPGTDGKSFLWVRPLEPNGTARMLEGTDGASYPFWSPGGDLIGFSAGAEIKAIPVSAGGIKPVSIRGGATYRRGSWNSDGVILFATNVLRKVSALGGQPSDLTTLDASAGDSFHSGPSFLPDGQHFLYRSQSAKAENQGIFVGSLLSDGKKRLLDVNSRAIYSSGYLLYTRGQALFAQPFDTKQLELTGEAAQILDGVLYQENLGVSAFDASNEGTLIYRNASLQATSPTLTVVPNWTSLLQRH